MKDCIVFNHRLYPGYEHRRTLGFVEGVSKTGNSEIEGKLCKTYMLVKMDPAAFDPLTKKKKKKTKPKPKPEEDDD